MNRNDMHQMKIIDSSITFCFLKFHGEFFWMNKHIYMLFGQTSRIHFLCILTKFQSNKYRILGVSFNKDLRIFLPLSSSSIFNLVTPPLAFVCIILPFPLYFIINFSQCLFNRRKFSLKERELTGSSLCEKNKQKTPLLFS
jgi:hypothetical protein